MTKYHVIVNANDVCDSFAHEDSLSAAMEMAAFDSGTHFYSFEVHAKDAGEARLLGSRTALRTKQSAKVTR